MNGIMKSKICMIPFSFLSFSLLGIRFAYNSTDVDINFFILSVDLYDAERNQEQNLVLHPSNAGSVPSSSAPTTPPPPPPPYHSQAQSYPNSEHPYYQHQYPYMPPPGNEAGYQHGPYVPQPYGQHQGGYGPPPQEYNSNVPQNYTRNLIGSLCASAFRLKDTKDELGIWFVLQDLSVRTEGTFTLKLSFFNVGAYVPFPLTPFPLTSFAYSARAQY